MAAAKRRTLPRVRRVVWILVAVVVVALVVGAVFILRPTSTTPKVASPAELQTALVPLSAMPAGTARIHFVGGGGSVSCTSAKPSVVPLTKAEVGYAQLFKPPKSAPGTPSELRDLFESVWVYASGSATQAAMNGFRAPPTCAAHTVSPLAVPHLASDQASNQQTIPGVGHLDFIYLCVNDSTILTVTSEGPPGAQTLNATEAFARQPYARAKSKLGG